MRWLREHSGLVVLLPSAALLLGGAVSYAGSREDLAGGLWAAAGVIGLVALLIAVIRGFVARTAGVDVLALLAIAGALATGEYLAAGLISVMVGTGSVLDQWAASAARRELGLLLSRAPRIAHRITASGFDDVEVEQVRVGDELHVGSGEIVPVDARLLLAGTFDESALTGESAPVDRGRGDPVRSGVVNAGPPVTMMATATAAESTYADVVRLVESAQAESSPYVRLADRMAWWFIPVSLVLAGGAWLASGEASRAVAVLVVATPCPLLLAVPIAVISGVSQAARRGVVIKGGQVLERLAVGRVLLLDKTGTLTRGHPSLVGIHAAPGLDPDEVLRCTASLDQASPHVLASAIVQAAEERGLRLELPQEVQEIHGHGIRGRVGEVAVAVGKASWILGNRRLEWADRARHEADLEGCVTVLVAMDGEPAAALLLMDSLRPDAPRMIRRLRSAGLDHMVLVTGDRPDLAESVGRLAGVDSVRSEQTPADKVTVVRQERSRGPVIMVGDGINDAPALATADVGVALAGRGATASSEAAGVVLTVDRIDRLGDAIAIARRAGRIARQSAWLGMTLSGLAMVAAAFGLLPAAIGALLQELIDVLAIGSALRVRLVRTPGQVSVPARQMAVLKAVAAEHDAVSPIAERIRAVADDLAAPDPVDPLADARALLHSLQTDLLPHEEREERELLPALAGTLGGVDPTGPLSRTHAEIAHQVSRLERILTSPDLPIEDAVLEAQRTLYVLYGVLRLHNAQEEEGLFSLME